MCFVARDSWWEGKDLGGEGSSLEKSSHPSSCLRVGHFPHYTGQPPPRFPNPEEETQSVPSGP